MNLYRRLIARGVDCIDIFNKTSPLLSSSLYEGALISRI